MAMNIKSDEAHRLATKLAAKLGTSLTEAVTVALRETLERTASPAKRRDALEALTRDTATRMPPAANDQNLYGDDGLPA